MKKEVADYYKQASEARELFFNAKYMDDGQDGAFSAEHLLKLAEGYIKALEAENHFVSCKLAEHQVVHWPRIKDLPEEERVPFKHWLRGQTCPLITNLPYEQQDAYYEHDYQHWKLSLKGHKVPWD